MATITRFPFVRHLRGTATTYTECLTNGRRSNAGVGASFWFRPLTSAISEIPIDGATTAAVTGILTGYSLREVLGRDVADLAAEALARLRADQRLTAIGIEVIGIRFALLRPEPEVERALQLPAREQVQQEADKATFERRALAVEREAAIGENELANQIELARRQEQLIAQKGTNARREAEDAARADSVRVKGHGMLSTNTDRYDPGKYFPWSSFYSMINGGAPPPSGPAPSTYWVDTYANAPGYGSPTSTTQTGTLYQGTSYVYCKT